MGILLNAYDYVCMVLALSEGQRLKYVLSLCRDMNQFYCLLMKSRVRWESCKDYSLLFKMFLLYALKVNRCF